MKFKNFKIWIGVLATGLLAMIGWIIMSVSAKNKIPMHSSLAVVLATELPSQFNHREVRSATQYLIMAHLMRPLVHLNRDAQIEGDLAESWKIEDSFSKYTFQIAKNARWSDGGPISVDEIARGIQAQMKVGSTTHFDFRTIQSVETSPNTLVIRLKESNPGFLTQLVHPEFGPVRLNPGNDSAPDLSVTAGAYSILSSSLEEIVLVRNPHFPFAKGFAPEKIRLTGAKSVEDQFEHLRTGRADVIIPMNGVTPANFSEMKNNPIIQAIDTHVGYTFWLAPNFTSSQFRDVKARQWLAAKLSDIKIDFDAYQPYWSRARQIFLNDGFGRPTEQELNAVFLRIKEGAGNRMSTIRFLVSSRFPFTQAVVDALIEEGIEVHLDVYQDIGEFETKMKAGQFDLMQINNDFSSFDVLENLSVTFSSSRPLIAVGQDLHQYQEQLVQARQMQSPDTKHTILKKIGLDLLENVAVIPITYRKNILLASKSWDYSGWSNLYPDVRFWKIQPAELGVGLRQ